MTLQEALQHSLERLELLMLLKSQGAQSEYAFASLNILHKEKAGKEWKSALKGNLCEPSV